MAVARSASPVPLILKRSGGAIIVADLSIWAGVGTAAEKRVAILTFTNAIEAEERIDQALAPGLYSCVLRVIVREDLRGDYAYDFLVDTDLMAADAGDVDTGPEPGQGIATAHKFGIRVTA